MKIDDVSWKTILSRSLGFFLLGYIFTQIDFDTLFSYIQNMEFSIFVLGLAIIPLIYSVKALRWKLFLRLYQIDFPFRECFSIYIMAAALGSITPGRIGDFLKIYLLKEKGKEISSSFIGVVLDRIFDIASLFLFASISTFVIFSGLSNFFFVSTFFAIVVFSFGLAFLWKGHLFLKYTIRRFKNTFIGGKFKNMQLGMINGECDNSRISWNDNLQVIFLSLLGWILYFYMYQILLNALGIHLDFLEIACACSMAIVSTFLPISVAGIGSRDAVLILVFSQMNIPKEVALIFSSIILLNFILITLWGGGLWILRSEEKKHLSEEIQYS